MDIVGALEALAGANFENLFVIAGLAFLALAIIGDISGRIKPGRGGRIASGIIGAALVVTGLLIHGSGQVHVKALEVAAGKTSYVARCPVDLSLSGIIEAVGSGTVIYEFEYSDGSWTPPASIEFERGDSKLVTAVWSVSRSLPQGWALLRSVTPGKLESKKEQLSVRCEDDVPPAGSSPPPSPVVAFPPRGEPVAQPARPSTEDSRADSVELAATTPPPGLIKRGQPVPFDITVNYNLVTVDAAILSISVAQLPASATNCHGPGGDLTDAVEAPIARGRGQARLSVTGPATPGPQRRAAFMERVT